MTKATISSKGQIAIPKAVRVDVQGEALVMKRFVRNYPDWRTMRGMFRGSDLLKDLTDDRAAEIARDHDRLQGR